MIPSRSTLADLTAPPHRPSPWYAAVKLLLALFVIGGAAAVLVAMIFHLHSELTRVLGG
jgi:hypothetical protein